MRWIFLPCLALLLSACGLPDASRSLRHEEPSTQIASSRPPLSGSLRLYFPYVGQGDATVLLSPSGKTMLIDAGPPESGLPYLLPLLQKLEVEKIDLFVLTHYHLDHFGGLSELIKGPDGILDSSDDLEIVRIFDRGGAAWDESPADEYWDEYLDLVDHKGIERVTWEPGQSLNFDQALKVRCLASNGRVWFQPEALSTVDLTPDTYSERENASSLAFLVEFGDFRYLSAGDLTGGGSLNGFLTPDVETLLGEAAGPVDFLHANHHGSASSSNPAFISATSPEGIIIQAGVDNPHRHPASEVVERWETAGTKVYSTAQGEGYLLISEGSGFEIEILPSTP